MGGRTFWSTINGEVGMSRGCDTDADAIPTNDQLVALVQAICPKRGSTVRQRCDRAYEGTVRRGDSAGVIPSVYTYLP